MGQPNTLIALVNDDTAYLELMEELLNEEGYRAVVSPVGKDAYQMIRKGQPRLVILDIAITHPDSGWVVLSLIRLDPTTTQIPVMVCSANTPLFRDSADRLREMRCETLEKPFDLEAMLAKIREIIGPPPQFTT